VVIAKLTSMYITGITRNQLPQQQQQNAYDDVTGCIVDQSTESDPREAPHAAMNARVTTAVIWCCHAVGVIVWGLTVTLAS